MLFIVHSPGFNCIPGAIDILFMLLLVALIYKLTDVLVESYTRHKLDTDTFDLSVSYAPQTGNHPVPPLALPLHSNHVVLVSHLRQVQS